MAVSMFGNESVPPWLRPKTPTSAADAAQQAMQTGAPATYQSGGNFAGAVNVAQNQPGVVQGAGAEDAWRKAMGGMNTTQTFGPVGGVSSTKMASPLGIQDLAAAAQSDIEAQKQAKTQNRATVEQSITGITDAYGRSMDTLNQHLADVRSSLDQYTQLQTNATGQFERARQFASGVYDRTQQVAGQITQQAQDYRTAGLDAFTDGYALRMDQASRGLFQSYNQKASGIDDMLAQGAIGGYGGFTSSEVAGAMKTQLKQEYTDQLRAFSGQLGEQQARLAADVRMQYDTMATNARVSGAGLETQAGMGAANIYGQMAQAEAQLIPAIEFQRKNNELDLLKLNVGIQQLGLQAPELAAELRNTSQYLADPVLLYPIMQELYGMYEPNAQANAASLAAAQGGSVKQGGASYSMRVQTPSAARPSATSGNISPAASEIATTNRAGAAGAAVGYGVGAGQPITAGAAGAAMGYGG